MLLYLLGKMLKGNVNFIMSSQETKHVHQVKVL